MLRRRLLRMLRLAGVTALGGLVLLALLQRSLLYFPTRVPTATALAAARLEGLQPWRDAQGTLLGWHAPHPSGAPAARLLVLHGNAGSAIDRTYFRDVFQDASPGRAVDVYLLEYPGYGSRPGTPSERSLVDATLAAIGQLRAVGTSPVVLLGESLGTGVASLAAAREPGAVAGLILVTPFTSIVAVAHRHFPFVPGFLVRDRYRADQALPRFPGPVAFLLAGRDEVVSLELGQALYDGRQGPRRRWLVPDAGHNTLPFTPGASRWREILDFVLSGQGAT